MDAKTQRLREKYAAAQEEGLLERLLEVGWGGLTAAQAGRIGGRMSARRRARGKER